MRDAFFIIILDCAVPAFDRDDGRRTVLRSATSAMLIIILTTTRRLNVTSSDVGKRKCQSR